MHNYTQDKNGVYIPDNSIVNLDFEQQYYALRVKENRIYPDALLAQLPVTPANHFYHKEWEMRRKSSQRLCAYMKAKNKPLRILEIGCGNGWLSNQLAQINESEVWAIDTCYQELQQAVNVFKNKNLSFIYENLKNDLLNTFKFDIVIFSASIQYFKSLPDTINMISKRLPSGGEIHIIDSPLYKAEEINAAKERSRGYYISIGFTEMSKFYFHHCIKDIKKFQHKILYNPKALVNYFSGNRNPFYWIQINN